MSETPSVEHPPVNPDVRYEPGDVNVRAIISFGVALGVMGVFIHLVLWWLFDLFASMERQNDRGLPPLARRERAIFPRDLARIPGPRLEESEEHDLKRLRQQEDAVLNHYDWADRTEKRVRIPIDEALERMADPDFAAAHGIRVRSVEERERMKKLEQPQHAMPTGKGGQP